MADRFTPAEMREMAEWLDKLHVAVNGLVALWTPRGVGGVSESAAMLRQAAEEAERRIEHAQPPVHDMEQDDAF